jgi:hypothetical protein
MTVPGAGQLLLPHTLPAHVLLTAIFKILCKSINSAVRKIVIKHFQNQNPCLMTEKKDSDLKTNPAKLLINNTFANNGR